MRVDENRDPSPIAASKDSQSVPSGVMVDKAVGYDAGKKLKGRKRFTLVDTISLLKAFASGGSEHTGTGRGEKQLLFARSTKNECVCHA